MLALLLLLLLLAADPFGQPTREQMTEALYDADNTCRHISARTYPCSEIPRRRLEALRCVGQPEEDPPRVLCIFAGHRARSAGGREERFGPECVYLRLGADGVWRITAYPDADVCESN